MAGEQMPSIQQRPKPRSGDGQAQARGKGSPRLKAWGRWAVGCLGAAGLGGWVDKEMGLLLGGRVPVEISQIGRAGRAAPACKREG